MHNATRIGGTKKPSSNEQGTATCTTAISLHVGANGTALRLPPTTVRAEPGIVWFGLPGSRQG